MKIEVGQRVGAISHSSGGTVYFLGYGVYEGEFVPDAVAGGFMGKMLHEINRVNPRIKLDNGKTVWGCECWWGPEEEVRASLDNFVTVIDLDIDEARAHAIKLSIPEDSEYVQIVRDIEDSFPGLDSLKTAVETALREFVGEPVDTVIEDLGVAVLEELALWRSLAVIKGLKSFAVDIEGNEVSVAIGILTPENKEVNLEFVLKPKPVEI